MDGYLPTWVSSKWLRRGSKWRYLLRPSYNLAYCIEIRDLLNTRYCQMVHNAVLYTEGLLLVMQFGTSLFTLKKNVRWYLLPRIKLQLSTFNRIFETLTTNICQLRLEVAFVLQNQWAESRRFIRWLSAEPPRASKLLFNLY